MEIIPAQPCKHCGNPRLPERALCAACYNAHRRAQRHTNLAAINEKRTAAERIKRAQRHAQNRCKECGDPLDPQADARRERCAPCRALNNTASNHRDRKNRLRLRGDSFLGSDPLHVGRNVEAGIVRRLSVTLDAETFAAFDRICRRVREFRKQQCKADGITDRAEISKRVTLMFQKSALLRHIITTYHRDFGYVPRRDHAYLNAGDFKIGFAFGADAATLAAVRHHARDHGSISRTICALICAAEYASHKDKAPQR